MVSVVQSNNKVTVAGHAGYANKGCDIVCAAISILVYNLEASVLKLTNDVADFKYTDEGVFIEFCSMSETSKILLNSFIIGIDELANNYPDYVELKINWAGVELFKSYGLVKHYDLKIWRKKWNTNKLKLQKTF